MSDGVWGGRQPPSMYPPSSGAMKRPRSDYDMPPSRMGPGADMLTYVAQDDDRGGHRGAKDTETIASAYDRYLQSTQQNSSNAHVEASALSRGPSGRGVSLGEPSLLGRPGPPPPEVGLNGPPNGFGGQLSVDTMPRSVRDTMPLPHNASNTLYVEGLPSNITEREVAHIFRPFVGYREVRLVTKEAKHRGGDPLKLCFVDFIDPACAATAMSALQGYMMDEDDRDSSHLRIQFSRNPGARFALGSHGRR